MKKVSLESDIAKRPSRLKFAGSSRGKAPSSFSLWTIFLDHTLVFDKASTFLFFCVCPSPLTSILNLSQSVKILNGLDEWTARCVVKDLMVRDPTVHSMLRSLKLHKVGYIEMLSKGPPSFNKWLFCINNVDNVLITLGYVMLLKCYYPQIIEITPFNKEWISYADKCLVLSIHPIKIIKKSYNNRCFLMIQIILRKGGIKLESSSDDQLS